MYPETVKWINPRTLIDRHDIAFWKWCVDRGHIEMQILMLRQKLYK